MKNVTEGGHVLKENFHLNKTGTYGKMVVLQGESAGMVGRVKCVADGTGMLGTGQRNQGGRWNLGDSESTSMLGKVWRSRKNTCGSVERFVWSCSDTREGLGILMSM